MSNYIDKPTAIRKGEELDVEKLNTYLKKELGSKTTTFSIAQFPGGFSNLTYLIKSDESQYVLRKPPIGANIKSAHDMGREFKVLSLLAPVYSKIPKPLLFCEDVSIVGAPFYLMERVSGLILRNSLPKGLELKSDHFTSLSKQAIENLATLHNLDLKNTGLLSLGKPEGYAARQVEGWTRRYFKAETETLKSMNFVAEWMPEHMPVAGQVAFLHNDYKYDNLVLDPQTLKIKAVLDWEMATVGDPLMDLGASLAYWVEQDDNPALKHFNLTWLAGNLNREEVIETYGQLRNINLDHILFYYVFGSFKLAVIVQQIYARYQKGLTKDKRFASLIYLVKACAQNAQNAIKFNRIHHFS